MVLYIRYTLYFIAYTSLPRRARPYLASYAVGTNSVDLSRVSSSSRGTTRLHAERAPRILCRWRTRSASDSDTLVSPFHAFSPFLSLSLPFPPPSPSRDHLRPPPVTLSFSPARLRRRNIFPGHYFYRLTAVRTCARSAILSAN